MSGDPGLILFSAMASGPNAVAAKVTALPAPGSGGKTRLRYLVIQGQ